MSDPQWHNQKDLRAFYSGLVARGWRHLTPLLDRLDALLALRDEMGLFTFTSHEVLCFTRHPVYPAWSEDDRVAIAPLRSGKVELGFIHHQRQTCDTEVVDYAHLLAGLKAALLRLSHAPKA
jgi:hypothetical protein